GLSGAWRDGQRTCSATGEASGVEGTRRNGPVCARDLVCLAEQWVPCTAGTICQPVGKPCRIGGTSCATGAPTCVEIGNADDGVSCGANLVCSGGSCATCSAGLACTPANNSCHRGMTACSPAT